MLSAILKAPFARSVFLGSVSRYAKHAASAARPLLSLDARRTFLTTASMHLKEKEKKPKKEPKEPKEPKAVKEPKEPKAVKKPKDKTKPKKRGRPALKPSVKKAAVTVKSPRAMKRDLKIPRKWPATPWQDFYQKYLLEHRKEGEPFIKYSTEGSAAWNLLSAEEKAKYGASEEERDEYKKFAKEFRSSSLEYKRAFRKLRKRKRDIPLGGYNLFVREKYDRNSSLSFVEQGTETAKQWNALTPEEKEVYKQRGIDEYEKNKAEQVKEEA